MDLFAEQALWPSVIAAFREAYSTLNGLGCSDEALTHELWLSKEPAEVFERCADEGFVAQLAHHSTVSQYGQLKGSMEVDVTAMKKDFKRIAEERILGGSFALEFSALDKDDEGGSASPFESPSTLLLTSCRVHKKLDELYAEASKSELVQGEKRVRDRMGLNKAT